MTRHTVKAFAAATVVAAAALPVAIATGTSVASAASSPALYCSQNDPVSLGQASISGAPYCGSMPYGPQNSVLQFYVYGSNLGFDNGPVSATTTATGVTVLGVTENNTFSAVVDLYISGTTAPGYYGLSITDGNGTSSLKNAFGVDPGSTATAVNPTTVPEGAVTLITVTGTNLTDDVTADAADPAGFTIEGGYRAPQVNAAGTQLTFYVATTATLALGTYGVDIAGLTTDNIDGNPGVNITVTGAAVYAISPSEYLENCGPTVASTLTITGSGFQAGASVYINGSLLPYSPFAGLVFGAPTVVNGTTITVPVSDGACNASVTQWNVTVTDPNGTTSTGTGFLGWNEAGLSPAAGSSTLTLNADDLAPGLSYIYVTGSALFPMAPGNTVTLTLGRFSFTGTVTAVSAGNEATIAFDLPSWLSTTTTAAVVAGATSVPVASTSGVPLSVNGVTFADTGDTQTVTGTNPSTSTLTIAAGVTHAHVSGATVEWPIGGDNPGDFAGATGWTLNVNNGTSVLSLAGLPIGTQGPASVSIINTEGNSQVLTANATALPVPLAPGTYTFLVNFPGADLANTGNTIKFSTGGTDPAGITGTIVATGQDSAWVTVTEPGSSTQPTYTATGDTLAAATVAGQTSISVSAVTGLHAGSTYSIGGAAPGSEDFTIAATWDGVSTTIPLTAALGVGHNSGTAIDSISYPQPVGIDYSATVVSGNGALSTYPLFVTATNDFSFTCISLSTSCPATPGLTLGAGATNVPVYIDGAFTNTNPFDYVVTSTTPGVSFGQVTEAAGGYLYTTVSVAAGTAVNTNVEYTVVALTGEGTYALPNAAQVNSNFLIGMTPTITAVTGIPSSMVPGESATFTVTGTFFDSSTTAVFLADSGNLAGTPDLGSQLGVDTDGVSTSCVDTSSTLLTCTVHVSRGSTNGAHDLLIENGEYGTAVSTDALNVVNATIGSISPTTYQSDSAVATFTLSGLTGFNVSQGMPDTHALITTFYADGSEDYSLDGLPNVTVTYAGPNSVTVTMPALTAAERPAGGLLVVTLYQDPSASGYGVEIDAPAIPLGLPLVAGVSPVAVTPAGTSSGFAIEAFSSSYPAPFDGPTTFQPGATVTAPAGSGVTVSGVTVLPGLITGTVAVAAGTPSGDVTLTITNPDGGVAYVYIYVSPSPIITAVNGVPVITGPVSFLNGSSSTLVITGDNFEAGAVVSDSVSADATFGTASVNAAGTTLTVSVTFIGFTGATPLSTNLVVTNPDGGVGVVPGELVINPQPDVTGGPYYVPTFTTNNELVVTGTGFEQGMTVSSSNSAYTVSIANVLPTSVTLLVTTSSAATSGTSSTLTFTNPDGGTTTMVLNGGPVPLPKPLFSALVGRPAHIGGSTTWVITGQNLANMSASIAHKGVSVAILLNNSTSVTVRVTVAAGVKVGTAWLILTNANGHLSLKFSIKR